MVDTKTQILKSLEKLNPVTNPRYKIKNINEYKKLLVEIIDSKDPENENITDLANYAAEIGHVEAIDFLLNIGMDVDIVDQFNYSPLMIAANSYQEDLVDFLINKGANVNIVSSCGKSALYLAASKGYGRITEILLNSGSDINAQENTGMSALLIAASNGYEDVVDLLIKRGADVNVKNTKNLTPLHFCAHKGNTRIVNLLLDNGANIHDRTNDCSSALHLACYERHIKVVKSLIKRGADINLQDIDLRTPLMIAAIVGDNITVSYLLNKQARQDLVDLEGDTALDCAKIESPSTADLINQFNQKQHLNIIKQNIEKFKFELIHDRFKHNFTKDLGGKLISNNYYQIQRNGNSYTYPININSKLISKIKESFVLSSLFARIDLSKINAKTEIDIAGSNVEVSRNNKILEININGKLKTLNTDEKYGIGHILNEVFVEFGKEVSNKTQRSFEQEIGFNLLNEVRNAQSLVNLKNISEIRKADIRNILDFYNNELPQIIDEGAIKQSTKDVMDKYVKEIQEYQSELALRLLPLFQEIIEDGKKLAKNFLKSPQALSAEIEESLNSGIPHKEYIEDKVKRFKSEYLKLDFTEIDELNSKLSELTNLTQEKIYEIKSPSYKSDLAKEKEKRLKRGRKVEKVDDALDIKAICEEIEALEKQISDIEERLTEENDKPNKENRQSNRNKSSRPLTKDKKKTQEIQAENQRLNGSRYLCENLSNITNIDKKLYNIMKISGKLSLYYRDVNDLESSTKLANLRHYLVHNPFGATEVLKEELDDLQDGLKKLVNGNDIEKVEFSDFINQIFNQNSKYEKNFNPQDLENTLRQVKISQDVETTKYNIIKLCEFDEDLLKNEMGEENYHSLRKLRNNIAHDYRSEEFSKVTSKTLEKFIPKICNFTSLISEQASCSSRISLDTASMR